MKYLTVLIPIILFGCTGIEKENEKQRAVETGPWVEKQDALEAEPWVGKEFSEWPQLVLTNDARFDGHTPLYGASAFLLKNAQGKVFGATARHLIGSNGGVNPEVKIGEFNRVLKDWILFPRTQDTNTVHLTSIGVSGLDNPRKDWLILNVAGGRDHYPAHPLTARKEPVKVGETVYLVGVPYSDRTSSQNVYKGKVTQRALGNSFRYDIDPPVDIRGFSGAPIIDERGHVVGVMSLWFNPKMKGGKDLESGGEDVASIFNALNDEK